MKRVIFIISILSIVLSGCSEEFLERDPLSEISNETFWKDIKDAELALAGVYDGLQSRTIYGGDGSATGRGITQFEFVSDNGYIVWSWQKFNPLSTGDFNSTTWGSDQLWAACYVAIVRANNVIENVPNIESMTTAERNRIVAEAKVVRATVYNTLAMTYSDVPLITTVQTLEESKVPKNTKAEIVSFIIADLESCYADLPLPTTVHKWGRLTQGAALGMLARIYLYNEDWEKAASTAQKVMDLGYSLFPDYSVLFKPANEESNEVIFPITFDSGSERGEWIEYSGRGYVNYIAALPNLVNDFYGLDGLPKINDGTLIDPAVRDPRLLTSIISRDWPGWGGGGREKVGKFFPRKYMIDDPSIRADSPQDFYLIRYAHILLIRAEALAQQGTDPEIYTLLNQLRDRVGMPKVEDVEGTSLSQQELLDLVKHERRVETAFEGLRYFDIKRWNEIAEKYTYFNENEYDNYLGVPGARYHSSMRKRDPSTTYDKWPLPQSELDANENLKQHGE